jgi:uncharacterized membrane protein YbhN (UPF0104 family)
VQDLLEGHTGKVIREGLLAALPTLEDSVRAFLKAAETLFSNLAAIGWIALITGLLLHGAYVTLRTRAWFNTLRAAYPAERFRWRNVWASYTVGLGVNSVVPARAGEVARLYLARQSVPSSSYPAVGSSFLVEAIFDFSVGAAMVAFAFSQGVFPDLPHLSRLPAFDLSYLAQHPRFALFLLTSLTILALVAVAVLSARVKAFWARVRQGLTILRDRRRYLRQVVALQALGWCFRFASFWLILEAFRIGGGPREVVLAMAVSSLSTLVPFTPSGAGAQQALLALVFAGAASASTVVAYSVGQQLALAAFNVLVGLTALSLVFGTRDWRSVIRRGREERHVEEGARAG